MVACKGFSYCIIEGGVLQGRVVEKSHDGLTCQEAPHEAYDAESPDYIIYVRIQIITSISARTPSVATDLGLGFRG